MSQLRTGTAATIILLISCGPCQELESIHEMQGPNPIPSLVVTLVKQGVPADGGGLDSDAGCVLLFGTLLGPGGVESGAEAVNETGLVGGWVNLRNSVLPALWFHDGGTALIFDSSDLIAGRVWAFSSNAGVGEALVRGEALQAALFHLDGGVELLGVPVSVARAGTMQAVGGISNANLAIWQGNDGYVLVERGSVMGSDAVSRFSGKVEPRAGESYPVLIAVDGGASRLFSDARNGAALSVTHSSSEVVGYIEGRGDLVPVRWMPDGGLHLLPLNRQNGAALSIDETSSIVGTAWTPDPSDLPVGVAWSPQGVEIPFDLGAPVTVKLAGSLGNGTVVGQCIFDGLTRGCIFRRTSLCQGQ